MIQAHHLAQCWIEAYKTVDLYSTELPDGVTIELISDKSTVHETTGSYTEPPSKDIAVDGVTYEAKLHGKPVEVSSEADVIIREKFEEYVYETLK